MFNYWLNNYRFLWVKPENKAHLFFSRSSRTNELLDWLCGIQILFIHIKTEPCRIDMVPRSRYQRTDLSRHLLLCALSVNQCEAERLTLDSMDVHLRTLIHNTEQHHKINPTLMPSFPQRYAQFIRKHSICVITCCMHVSNIQYSARSLMHLLAKFCV